MIPQPMLPDDPLAFIKACVRQRSIFWTYHVNMRLQRRSIARQAILTVREGQFGWGDVQGLPDGAVVLQWVQDDTLPTGPYHKERRWLAPFARASREDDYRIAGRFLRPRPWYTRPPTIPSRDNYAMLTPGTEYAQPHFMLKGSTPGDQTILSTIPFTDP